MSQRLKGDECVMTYTSPAGLEEIGDISNFTFEMDLEILRERYTGETAERKDELWKGVKGGCELHMENSKMLRFTQIVQDRAQRRTPASAKISCTVSFAFPDGTRARLVFDDIFFGAMPFKIPSGNYVQATVSWECSTLKRFL